MYNGLFTWLLKNSLYLAEQCSNHNVPIFYCKQLLCHEPKLKKKLKTLKSPNSHSGSPFPLRRDSYFSTNPWKAYCHASASHLDAWPRVKTAVDVLCRFQQGPYHQKRERDEIKIPHRNAHKSITSLTYSKCSEPEPGLRTGSEFFPSPLHLILEFCKAPLNIVLKVIYKLISSLF